MRELEHKYKNDIEKICFKHCYEIGIDEFALLSISTKDEDVKQSFDMIFRECNKKLSVRIRTNQFIKFNDITIRTKSKNGGRTELDKILEGKSDIYFYAYQNKNEDKIVQYHIVDINIIRAFTKQKKYTELKNYDGTEFYAYKFNDIINYANQNNLLYINSN